MRDVFQQQSLLHLYHGKQEEELKTLIKMDGGNVPTINVLELCTSQKVFIFCPSFFILVLVRLFMNHSVFGSELTQSPYTEEGIASIYYLYQCIDEIIRLIDVFVKRFPYWDANLQVRAGIAAWDAGVDLVFNHEVIDVYTKNSDYSSDILARAQFYTENGYG